MKRQWIEITKEVAVSVIHRDDQLFDVAVMTCWFPFLNKNKWEIEKDCVNAAEGLSSMQVYGYIEHQVKPAYLK
ncbi:MAG: hypothetical protein ACQEXX_01750 [Bacillota bacterium]